MPEQPIRILIADDQALVRTVIADLIQSQPDMQLVGEAEGGIQAIEMCLGLSPDLLILDLTMPDLDGLQVLRKIKAIGEATRVLVLTMHEDMEHLIPVLEAGAGGYVAKSAEDDEILRAIRSVNAGKSYIKVNLTKEKK